MAIKQKNQVPNEVSPEDLTKLAKEAGKPIRYYQPWNGTMNYLWAYPEGYCSRALSGVVGAAPYGTRSIPRFTNYWHAWAYLIKGR